MVAAGIGVGVFPRQLGMKLIAEGRIIEFDPGWTLGPLIFTASHLGDPRSELCAQAAALEADEGEEEGLVVEDVTPPLATTGNLREDTLSRQHKFLQEAKEEQEREEKALLEAGGAEGGAEPPLTAGRVRRAYYRASLEWHPDRWSAFAAEYQDEAEAVFTLVGSAYEALLTELAEQAVG